MPYTKREQRLHYNEEISTIAATLNNCHNHPGDLNYILTRIAVLYTANVEKNDCRSYVNFNETYGVLKGVAAEFYRRVMFPYEDMKCSENGDVYEELL